jgi:hypothetical protein
MLKKNSYSQDFPFSKLPLVFPDINMSNSIEKVKEGIDCMKRSINSMIIDPFNESQSKIISNLKNRPIKRRILKMKVVKSKKKLKQINSEVDNRLIFKEITSPLNSVESAILSTRNIKDDSSFVNEKSLEMLKAEMIGNRYNNIRPINNKGSLLITELNDLNIHSKEIHLNSRILQKSLILPRIDIDSTSNNYSLFPSNSSVKESFIKESFFKPILDTRNIISPKYNKNTLEIKDQLSKYYRLAGSEINSSKIFEKNMLRYQRSAVRKSWEDLLRPLENEEIRYLRQEQKKLTKPVIIYNSDSKKRKDFVSQNRQELLAQIDFVSNTNSEGVYKFKKIFYERFGKKEIQDRYYDHNTSSERRNEKSAVKKDNHQKVQTLLREINKSHNFLDS